MKAKRLLHALPFVALCALFALLGLLAYVLAYYLGEKANPSLTGDLDHFLEVLPEALRLGHVKETANGEITVFIGGVRHDYHIVSAEEALVDMLQSLMRGDLGQAVSVQDAVASFLGPSLGRSALIALGSSVLIGASTFGRKQACEEKWKLIACLACLLALVLGGVFAYLVPQAYYVCLGIGVIAVLAAAYVSNFGLTLWQSLRNAAAFFGAAQIYAIVLGAIVPNAQGTLSQLLFYAFRNQDNHVYAPTLLLLIFGFGLTVLLWACFAYKARKDVSPKGEKEDN